MVNSFLRASDADGDPLTYAIVTQPANGTVTLNAATGAFSYTTTDTINESDSFTFSAHDGITNGAPALVSITINVFEAPPYTSNDGAGGGCGLGAGAALLALLALLALARLRFAAMARKD